MPRTQEAWGEEYTIELRESEYHAPGRPHSQGVKIWLAEIEVGEIKYPYAGWGETQHEAFRDLAQRIEKAEAIFKEPPRNTTQWHIATSQGGEE